MNYSSSIRFNIFRDTLAELTEKLPRAQLLEVIYFVFIVYFVFMEFVLHSGD